MLRHGAPLAAYEEYQCGVAYFIVVRCVQKAGPGWKHRYANSLTPTWIEEVFLSSTPKTHARQQAALREEYC